MIYGPSSQSCEANTKAKSYFVISLNAKRYAYR
jgi:hypothetical protein